MFAAIDDWALAVDGVVAGLVNNAGVLNGPNGCKSVEHASLEDLNAIFAVNVAGPMLCTREALQRMSTKISAGGKGSRRRRRSERVERKRRHRPPVAVRNEQRRAELLPGWCGGRARGARRSRQRGVPGMTDTNLIDDIRDLSTSPRYRSGGSAPRRRRRSACVSCWGTRRATCRGRTCGSGADGRPEPSSGERRLND